MRSLTFVLLALAAAGCQANADEHVSFAAQRSFTATVIAVDDGDTLWVKPIAAVTLPPSVTVKPDGSFKLRLWIADAPEIAHNSKQVDQPGGQAAKKYSTSEVLNDRISVIDHGYSYDRVVGEVTFNHPTSDAGGAADESLGLNLLRHGFAMADPRYKPPPDYLGAQADATAAKRGIWGESPPPIPPWQWRKEPHPNPSP